MSQSSHLGPGCQRVNHPDKTSLSIWLSTDESETGIVAAYLGLRSGTSVGLNQYLTPSSISATNSTMLSLHLPAFVPPEAGDRADCHVPCYSGKRRKAIREVCPHESLQWERGHVVHQLQQVSKAKGCVLYIVGIRSISRQNTRRLMSP